MLSVGYILDCAITEVESYWLLTMEAWGKSHVSHVRVVVKLVFSPVCQSTNASFSSVITLIIKDWHRHLRLWCQGTYSTQSYHCYWLDASKIVVESS
jgi:hypothetical protein